MVDLLTGHCVHQEVPQVRHSTKEFKGGIGKAPTTAPRIGQPETFGAVCLELLFQMEL